MLWQRLRHMQVAQLVIETTFSNDAAQVARLSHHLCPEELGHELQQLEGCVDVHITHIKPGEMRSVMAEIARLELPHRVRALMAGELMRLG